MNHFYNSKLKIHNSKLLQRYTWVSHLLLLGIIFVIYAWALQGLKVDFALLKDSWQYVIDFISRLFPPDLTVVDIAIKALIETVQMSLWGTTIGAIVSVPIAIASASNIAPSWLQWLANLLQNTVRFRPLDYSGINFRRRNRTGRTCRHFGIRNLHYWLPCQILPASNRSRRSPFDRIFTSGGCIQNTNSPIRHFAPSAAIRIGLYLVDV